MDDDGAPWNEWSASDVASKLVDDDGGLRSARLARERGASRERLRKERAKLKDHIKRVAGRKACDVGRADYDAVIAAQDRLPGLDEELKSLARDERAAAAAALRADHAAAEALRRAGVARRLGGDERHVARQGVAARRSLACRLDGIRGDAAVRAAKGCEIPNFKGSDLGRVPLVSADFWTSDHLSERSRSVDAFSGTRVRGTLTLKRR